MRRKYNSITRLRGGYKAPRPSVNVNVKTGNQLPPIVSGALDTYGKVSKVYSRLPLKYRKMLKKTMMDIVGNVARGRSPMEGVLPIPGSGVLVGKSIYQTITNRGTGLTYTNTKIGKYRPNTLWVREGQKYVFRRMNGNSCFKIKNGSGFSNGLKGYNYLTREWIATCVGHYYTGTGSTSDRTQDSYLSQTAITGDMYIHSCKSTVRITSSTNLNVNLRIYDLTAKYETSNSNVTDPQNAIQYGLDAAYGTNNAQFAGMEGIYPSHSKYFRDVWAVNKYTDISLPAGASHIHTVTRDIHHVFPLWKQSLITDQEHLYSGITGSFYFVLTPTPVHDQTNEDNVGLGVCSVDVVITTTVETYGKTAASAVLNSENIEDLVTTQEIIADTSISEDTIDS